MLDTQILGRELGHRNFTFFSGVPCSHLTPLINYSINEADYVMAANEGQAVAHCAGATLAGKRSIFLCQNSGLCNASSPLTSLNHTFQIPLLGFVSYRGGDGIKDEPQHQLTGEITTDLLDSMQIQWEFLTSDAEELPRQLELAESVLAENRCFFFVVKKATLSDVKLTEQPSFEEVASTTKPRTNTDELPLRWEVIDSLKSDSALRDIFIATTGHTGRELYEAGDSPNSFYMVGSMGCVSSLSLGLALSKPEQPVICLDGDGGALMHLGAFAVVGERKPANLLHILFDNECHLSTGGQYAPQADFVQIAKACGYPFARYCHSAAELLSAVSDWRSNPILTFLTLKVKAQKKPELSRPSVQPTQVRARLQEYLMTS